MFHFVGKNSWLPVASGFDKGKLDVMVFLNNLFVRYLK